MRLNWLVFFVTISFQQTLWRTTWWITEFVFVSAYYNLATYVQSKTQTVAYNLCTSLLWYITDVYTTLWLVQIFTPFQVNKTRFDHQQLWNLIIYCCYCTVFVDLLSIFEFTMCFGYFYHFAYRKSKFHSIEFATIHALTLQFNSTPHFSMHSIFL